MRLNRPKRLAYAREPHGEGIAGEVVVSDELEQEDPDSKKGGRVGIVGTQ